MSGKGSGVRGEGQKRGVTGKGLGVGGEIGSRVEVVERWFGISASREMEKRGRVEAGLCVMPVAGEIVMITGASGSGKSTLLREYRRRIMVERRIELDRMRLPRRAIVDLFEELPLEGTLRLLSRVGLAEAHSYVLPPGKLSDGQRWRLRLAMAFYEGARGKGLGVSERMCILADEFGGLLDGVTAAVVAHALRKMIDESEGLCAIVASSREELAAALRPDRVVRCDFGRTTSEV